MKTLSDGQLLRDWIAGNHAAFGALVVCHEAALLRHARALLGPNGGHEDVVQEAFLRLAKSPPELPDGEDDGGQAEHALLAGWLHRVTRNLCMDTLRSDSRRRTREEFSAPAEALLPDAWLAMQKEQAKKVGSAEL